MKVLRPFAAALTVFLLFSCGEGDPETQNQTANQTENVANNNGDPNGDNEDPNGDNEDPNGDPNDDPNDDPAPTPTACEAPVDPPDTSDPDQVVGDGTPDSCTEDALRDAVDDGGIIAFDCGDEEVTIEITEALELRTDTDTTIDGGGLIVLDGGRDEGRQNRIFHYHSPDYRATDTLVTLMGLTVQNAEAPAQDFTEQDTDNPECAWGYRDGEGGALRMRDGRLRIFDSTFRGNRAADVGPDTGGGGLYAVGATEVTIVDSTFIDNAGSNGGAVGLLQADGVFYNSRFADNRATGEGQNFGGATGCPDFNHAEQGGAGGNGGAIAIDGSDVDEVDFCGVVIRGNEANELATVFRTPNTHRGTSTFRRVHFDENHAGDGGGAIWMQDMEFSMTESAVTNNTSHGLGAGVRIGQGAHGSTLELENTTIYGNVATESLGGGLVFSGEGVVRNVTFAENEAAGGEGYFGAAIVAHGDGYNDLEVYNTVFHNNFDDHQYTPMTCSIDSPGEPGVLPGDNNVQWPEQRRGGSDVDDNPCTEGIHFADVELGPLEDNGGPTPTAMPPEGSVAVGAGEDCPDTDQRGEPRPVDGCTIGAVEVLTE